MQIDAADRRRRPSERYVWSGAALEGGFGGPGNIDGDPQFTDADGRLAPGSPCIDAADNTAVPRGVTTDIDERPRFVDDPRSRDSGVGDPPVVDMDLAAMETRLIGAAARQVELSRDLAEALLVLYRLRSEIAADWETFRENNPYRWMAPEQRRASFALLAGTRSLEQRWRAAYDAIEGDRRKALRSAREAMEAALLREIELEP